MSKSYNHTTNYFLTVPTIYRPEVLSDENEFSQGYFSVSFEKNTKKGNSTEFELMPFRYNKYETINTLIKDSSNITKEIVSLNVVSFETYGKYFYYYQFCKFKNKIINPFVGLSTGFFYKQKIIKPEINNYYKQSDKLLGINSTFIIGFSLILTKKVNLEISIPYNWLSFQLEAIRNYNPRITESQQHIRNIGVVKFQNNYNARIGLVVRL